MTSKIDLTANVAKTGTLSITAPVSADSIGGSAAATTPTGPPPERTTTVPG